MSEDKVCYKSNLRCTGCDDLLDLNTINVNCKECKICFCKGCYHQIFDIKNWEHYREEIRQDYPESKKWCGLKECFKGKNPYLEKESFYRNRNSNYRSRRSNTEC